MKGILLQLLLRLDDLFGWTVPDESELKLQTCTFGVISTCSLVMFILLFAPLGPAERPGASIRLMSPYPLFVTALAMLGWIPAVVMGIRQLFCNPRLYGLITVTIGLLHLTGFILLEWVLIELRGYQWGS